MRKRAYVSYLLFPQVFSRLLLVWICTAIASAALYMVCMITINRSAAQISMNSISLPHAAFYSDIRAASTESFTEEKQITLIERKNTFLTELPGLIAISEQITLAGSGNLQLIAYPSMLIEQVSFLSQPALPLDAYNPPPVWLDSRMASTTSIGETVTIPVSINGQTRSFTFTVVGFLDNYNAYLDIGHIATTSIATAEDIFQYNNDTITAITVQEPLFLSDEFASKRSPTKILFFEPGTDLNPWKEIIIGNGLGVLFTLDEMKQAGNRQLTLAIQGYIAMGTGLLLLTLLGLGNVQYLLMRRCQHMAAVLRTCGMEWRHWQSSWLLALSGSLIFPCTLGTCIGVIIQRTNHPHETIVLPLLAIPIFLLILALTMLTLYPLLRRWQRESIVSVLYPSSQN